jgi:sensor histidine kinase regulating citrate/malate metabolism
MPPLQNNFTAMNNPETSPLSAEISEQIAALQHQVFTLLLALVVVSGTLVAFLFYQSHQLSKNIDGVAQEAGPIAKVFAQNQPVIQGFVDQLRVYSVTHPEFQPILKKYKIPTTAPTQK